MMNMAQTSVSAYKTSLTTIFVVYNEIMIGTSRSNIEAISFSGFLCTRSRAARDVNDMYSPMHMIRADALKSPFRAMNAPIAMNAAAITNAVFGLVLDTFLSIHITA